MQKNAFTMLVLMMTTSGIFAQTPEPPTGFFWSKQENLSDDFDNQTTLNTTKWYSRLPNWAGRKPAEFLPENVTVKDGLMRITNGVHPAPHDGYTMAGGGIETKATVKYGYMECRLKASKVRMSSTFWLNTTKTYQDSRVNNPNPTCLGYGAEIDILECMGGASNNATWNSKMNFNTHFKLKQLVNGSCGDSYLSKGGNANVNENVGDNYHVYAAWWVNPNLVHYYLDGVKVGSVNPKTEGLVTPLNVPMSIRMVTETYDWQITGTNPIGYPTNEELSNPAINTTYYDYVRTYKLMPLATNLVVNADLETGVLQAPWTSWATAPTGSVKFSNEAFEKFNEDWGAKITGAAGLEQTITVTANTNYKLSVMALKSSGTATEKAFLGVKGATDNVTIGTTEIADPNFKQEELVFNSGNRTAVKIYATAQLGATIIVDNFALLLSTTTSTSDRDKPKESKMKVFQGSDSKLNIEWANKEAVSVQVFDISGRAVFNQKFQKILDNKLTVNPLLHGNVYIVRVLDEKGNADSAKFVAR